MRIGFVLSVVTCIGILTGCVTTTYEKVSGHPNVRKVILDKKPSGYEMKKVNQAIDLEGWYSAKNINGKWTLTDSGKKSFDQAVQFQMSGGGKC